MGQSGLPAQGDRDMNWIIREGSAADADACLDVYVDAIHNGTAGHYTRDQALAWAPPGASAEGLRASLEAGTTWIAVSATRAEGFLTVTSEGYLDFLFVRPDARAAGLTAALYVHLLDWARERNLNHLTTHASHLARSFLEKRGWQVIAGEAVERHGVVIERWKMELVMAAKAPDAGS